MNRILSYSILMATIFIYSVGVNAEDDNSREREIIELKRTVAKAKERINNADIYRWKDALLFLPQISISRRSPYAEAAGEETETYLAASVSLSQFYNVADIEEKRKTDKRKAVRRIESLGFSIEKLIERKFLLKDQIWKMKQMAKSIEEPIEAASRQEKADQLVLQQNGTIIEIERLLAEIEYTCVEVER